MFSRIFLQFSTGIIILLAWLASLLTGLMTHDYEGLQLVTPIMIMYAGYIFGVELVKKKGNGRSNSSIEKEKDEE